MQNTAKQNYPGLAPFTTLGRKRSGFILQCSQTHTGLIC